MTIPSVPATYTLDQFRVTFNTLATTLGDYSLLDADIRNASGVSDFAEALNFVYSLASITESNFAVPIVMTSTLNVQGNVDFDANLNVDGSFGFDAGGPQITAISSSTSLGSSNTTLPTQGAVKSYVDTALTTVDAITLDGIDSASFLRSDVSDTYDTGLFLDIGGSANGAVRIGRITGSSETVFRPYYSASFGTARDFKYSHTNSRWEFGDELLVGGLFTTRGIDDNATSNKIQIENSAITLKTAVTCDTTLGVTGSSTFAGITVTSITGGTTLAIDNGANERVLFGADTVSLQVNSTTRIQATSAGAAITGTLSCSGAATFSSTFSAAGITSSSGLTVSSGSSTFQAISATTGTFSGAVTSVGFTSSSGLTVSSGTTTTQALSSTTGTFSGAVTSVGFTSFSGLTVSSGTTTTQTLSVTGNITATGNVTGTSDERLKDIIDEYTDGLFALENIYPVYYKWNDKAKEFTPSLDSKVHVGVLAQEVQTQIPEAAIKYRPLLNDNSEYLAVDHNALIAVCISAIKDLKDQVDELNDRILELEQER